VALRKSKTDENDDFEILDKNEPKMEAFWYLENGAVKASKEVPKHFQQEESTSPQLDCSVGGLYYKIYAEGHERRMAARVIIKPSYITHRRLYLAEEGRKTGKNNDAVFRLTFRTAYLSY